MDTSSILKIPFDIWQLIVKELTNYELTQLTRVSSHFRFLVPERSIPQIQYKKEVCEQITYFSNEWYYQRFENDVPMFAPPKVSIFILAYNRNKAHATGVKKPPHGYIKYIEMFGKLSLTIER